MSVVHVAANLLEAFFLLPLRYPFLFLLLGFVWLQLFGDAKWRRFLGYTVAASLALGFFWYVY